MLQPPTISEVAAYSDAQIEEILGHPAALEKFKKEIKALDALKGAPRTQAEIMWKEQMTPNITGGSLHWLREDAIAQAKKTPKETLDSSSPSSEIGRAHV